MLALGSKRIGITVDASGIRYASLGKKKGRELEKSGFFPFPHGLIDQDVIINEESLRISIRQWAREHGLQGASAVVAVPTSQVIVRKMSLPAVNEKELRQLIHLEVETAMHLPFENPVYDYAVLSRDAENTKVLVYAAPRSWIEPLSSMLREARIRVAGTGIAATALQGAIDPGGEDCPTEQMYVHLSGASAEIAMFHEGNPVFVRAIEEDNAQEGMDGLRIGELTAEIVRMLSFYEFGIHEGQARIRKAIITGGGEQVAALKKSLIAALPEIEFREAGPGAIAAGAASELAETYLIPAGLLVRNSSIRQLGLLPRVDREQRFAPLAAAMLAVAWIACAGLLAYSYVGERGDAADAQDRLVEASQLELSLQRQLSTLSSEENSGAVDPIEQAEQVRAAQRDAAGYIRDLEFYLPTGSELQSISYSSGGQLQLSIRTAAMKDASRYLFDSRRIAWLDQSTLTSLKQDQTGGIVNSDSSSGSAEASGPYSASYTLTLKPLPAEKEGAADAPTP
ncbi:type IV pilus assembly protein PilM [Paenibacillaceae bacterium GAS479]|nr:type IV pilus assembly protein PilM [Paenibacillaceae bacterium GAS479]